MGLDIRETLRLHALWVSGDPAGRRADLRRADLRRAVLSGAVLSDADLSGAVLSGAVLSGADLSDADLRRADLRGAVLSGAVLSDADLRRAVLSDAVLSDADLSGAVLPNFAVCPDTGTFTGWKKLYGGVIAQLEIPAEARRVSALVGRKCRAEFVRVLALSGGAEVGVSAHDRRTRYVVGEIVRPDSFDDDIRVECTNGIHFFVTRREAEEYVA